MAGGAAVAGGAAAFALDFRNKLAESDLTRIGNDQPSIVQIHDPNCGLCQQLQTQARRAVKLCSDDTTQFLVANIHSDTGAELQARLALPHVTLAFFDAQGRHVHTLEGVTPAETIKATVTQYFS